MIEPIKLTLLLHSNNEYEFHECFSGIHTITRIFFLTGRNEVIYFFSFGL